MALYRIISDQIHPNRFKQTPCSITKDDKPLWDVLVSRSREEFEFDSVSGIRITFTHERSFFKKITTLYIDGVEFCSFVKRSSDIGADRLWLDGSNRVYENQTRICSIDRPWRNESDPKVVLRWEHENDRYEVPIAYYACLTWVDADRF